MTRSYSKTIHLIAAARPNFMKIAPLYHALCHQDWAEPWIVHTGQHYDLNMSDAFFQDLGLPEPHVHLGVGSGTHAEQTGRVMMAYEKVLMEKRPELVVVVGDVNSTLACSIVAAKLCIPLAHVEAGLRSFDRTMPEEINRIVTDSLSDFLFTTCEDANENLKQEGVPEERIYFVGNVMIDTLIKYKAKAEVEANIKVDEKDYALLTLHRPSNVDDSKIFRNILEALQGVSKKIPIIFPAHPRTQKQIKSFGYEKYFNFIKLNVVNSINTKNSINLINPLAYLEFLNLMANAKFVLTDSGGIQEETTILDIPCLTLRENTERPITIKEGTNVLVGTDKHKIITESLNILNDSGKSGKIPKLWDGQAARRVVQSTKQFLSI